MLYYIVMTEDINKQPSPEKQKGQADKEVGIEDKIYEGFLVGRGEEVIKNLISKKVLKKCLQI